MTSTDFSNEFLVSSSEASTSNLVLNVSKDSGSIQMPRRPIICEETKGKENDFTVANHINDGPNNNKKERTPVTINDSLDSDTNWTTDLRYLPKVNELILDHKLVHDSETMPDKTAPKAHRNKIHGYKLWKEGYVSKVRVKPNVKADKDLFVVKSSVGASMKNIKYSVYCHLDQITGYVLHAKCSCKAGQGGCCKHVAALLYTLLDFTNLGIKHVPEDVTCTQKLQQWSIPGKKISSGEAVKFDALEFEKATYQKDKLKKRKRPLLIDSRNNYCATPPFAKNVTVDAIRQMSEAFEAAGKANLFTETLKGNNYAPCHLFHTSCTTLQVTTETTPTVDPMRINIFNSMPSEIDRSHIDAATLKKIMDLVAVTNGEAQNIEKSTTSQSQQQLWYQERAKRLTSSVFGKVINRREKIYPKSLMQQIQGNANGLNRAPSLKWGKENEKVALEKYKVSFCTDMMKVQECGFIVNPQWPWLGASPDGLLCQNEKAVGAIEIKCPYSKRAMSISEACEDKNFYLNRKGDKIHLKETHIYYYQCQGVMNITDMPWIDFVVYTEKDIFVERIICNKTLWFHKMLPKLTKFYAEFLLPNL